MKLKSVARNLTYGNERWLKIDIKEIRKNIRKCRTNTELRKLIEVFEFMGYKLMVRRRGIYECCDTKNADIDIREDYSIKVYLPLNWSCRFKNIKQFSYNIKMRSKK